MHSFTRSSTGDGDLARAVEGVPERYLRKVQYIDARENPEFMGELIAQIANT